MSTLPTKLRDRRQDPRTSLHRSAKRWLNAEAERQGFAAVVLADDQGSVVAASNTDLEADLIAAVAPLSESDQQRHLGEPHELVSSSLEILGDDYHLCAVRRREGGLLVAAAEGLVRILAA